MNRPLSTIDKRRVARETVGRIGKMSTENDRGGHSTFNAGSQNTRSWAILKADA